MSCSTAKRARLPCRIHELSNKELAEIFKRLPPFERLIVSEVCRRWHGISVTAWHDIKRLDLTCVPNKYICAVVKKCPNLQSCFAIEKDLGWRQTACIATAPNLSCVKFYHCKFPLVATLLDDPSDIHNIFRQIFSRNGQVQWQEFVLSDAWLDRPDISYTSGLLTKWSLDLSFLSASLTRLQLSGLRCDFANDPCEGRFLEGLEHLQNLECLILHSTAQPGYVNAANPRELIQNALWHVEDVFEKIGKLKNLRELCICWPTPEAVGLLLSRLPKLEVLFICNIYFYGDEDADVFQELVTRNSVLRILVLTGSFGFREPIELPVRKRFPNGFGSDPLPLLHVFVGKYAAAIHFGRSSTDAAIVLPINKPMPEFLERAEIAPIFDGVWVSERIKETAHNDGLLWFYDEDTVDSLHFI